MTIKIKIDKDKKPGDQRQPEKKPFSVPDIKIELELRKTLSGDLLITDHPDVDIVLMTKEKKIIAFAKENYSDDIYDTQDRLFKFLAKKGLIDRSSVQAGNVYGSMEASVPDSEYNEVQHSLLVISKFIEEEKPYYTFEREYEKQVEKRLSDPLPDESTEWNPEKYHDEEKGSIRSDRHGLHGIASIYRLEE
tara:strand:+ start:32 stop:607 length:576 start_codon:yes stop_codon:yes gene_type:complete